MLLLFCDLLAHFICKAYLNLGFTYLNHVKEQKIQVSEVRDSLIPLLSMGYFLLEHWMSLKQATIKSIIVIISKWKY